MIEIRYATIDDKHIAYTNQSLFEVQISKGKNKYKTRYSFTGDFRRAFMQYQMINIAAPYNKRLVCCSFNKPIIARYKGV